jgi:hypothetical protein
MQSSAGVLEISRRVNCDWQVGTYLGTLRLGKSSKLSETPEMTHESFTIQ